MRICWHLSLAAIGWTLASGLFAAAVVLAQAPAKSPPRGAGVLPPPPSGLVAPPGYVIGSDDVLEVVFWREKDMSGDVVVRPDGKISLPLINEVDAAGLTPEELRVKLEAAAAKFIERPNATVVVKQINSRKVFITGKVVKPGPYPLSGSTTVAQLISMAGGLQEFADSERIVILRVENGRQASLRFNYKQVLNEKNLAQNVELHAGDTVLVP